MTIGRNIRISLLCATSIIAVSWNCAAVAQPAENPGVETVVVTGSRVISSVANSPTPLTAVSTDQLEATTPGNVPDALNKLPVFIGSTSPRSINNASSNRAGNVLSLRNFGAQRTLVLFDGHRVAPSNSDGTVDVDTLPQMLMSRVDVVTGGASAVYGSDAVTGVVNFVLDKNFTGIKIDTNAGISGYADAGSYKFGAAAGTDLFGGRAHLEGSIQHYHKDRVKQTARPQGVIGYELTGAGTASNPFVTISSPTLPDFSFGGKISNCGGCAANGMHFIADGVLGPFNPGTPTGEVGLNTGGDGAYYSLADIASSLTANRAFGRFSYNVNDNVVAYVQVMGAESTNNGTFANNYLRKGTVPNTFFVNNPYLTPTAQALLANPTGKFQVQKYINNQGPNGGFQTIGTNRSVGGTLGLDGAWGDYAWSLYYTHGENRQKVDDPYNQNNQKMYAALDAVSTGAGQVACFAATQAATAAQYADCVPMNPFGPTALSHDAWDYFTEDSHFISTNVLDNIGGSIAGDVFDLPAGPVKAALSGEMRWMSYGVQSNALPSDVIDCTGLRICSSSTPFWQGNIVNKLATVSESVWEFAAEAEVPLLRDVPFIQDLSANLAGRYTDYSVSGSVQTWKIGLDYHVNDMLRFRGTTSIDIRAPTLDDLFSPQQLSHSSFADLHTGNIQGLTTIGSQGNPNLVPEVARTYTAGVVLTPSFIPGLTASVDYYNIVLKNVIGGVNGTSNSVQRLCEDSGGTSPYCSLYIRPLPFSDRTPANFPTEVRSQSLNSAFNKIEGLDIELDYAFEMADLMDSLPGTMDLRMLANIQPVQRSSSYPGAPISSEAVSKGHVTGFLSYTVGDWTFNLQDRWLSGFPRATLSSEVYVPARAPERNYVDITINKEFVVDDATLDGYLSVQNLLDQSPPIIPTNRISPRLYYLGIQGTNTYYDAIGRYFTIGLRARL